MRTVRTAAATTALIAAMASPAVANSKDEARTPSSNAAGAPYRPRLSGNKPPQ